MRFETYSTKTRNILKFENNDKSIILVNYFEKSLIITIDLKNICIIIVFKCIFFILF